MNKILQRKNAIFHSVFIKTAFKGSNLIEIKLNLLEDTKGKSSYLNNIYSSKTKKLKISYFLSIFFSLRTK